MYSFWEFACLQCSNYVDVVRLLKNCEELASCRSQELNTTSNQNQVHSAWIRCRISNSLLSLEKVTTSIKYLLLVLSAFHHRSERSNPGNLGIVGKLIFCLGQLRGLRAQAMNARVRGDQLCAPRRWINPCSVELAASRPSTGSRHVDRTCENLFVNAQRLLERTRSDRVRQR